MVSLTIHVLPSVDTALLYHTQSSNHRNSGEYHKAHSFGKAALGCNIAVLIYYGLSIVGGIVLIAVYFTVGFNTADDYLSPTSWPITECREWHCNYS